MLTRGVRPAPCPSLCTQTTTLTPDQVLADDVLARRDWICGDPIRSDSTQPDFVLPAPTLSASKFVAMKMRSRSASLHVGDASSVVERVEGGGEQRLVGKC